MVINTDRKWNECAHFRWPSGRRTTLDGWRKTKLGTSNNYNRKTKLTGGHGRGTSTYKSTTHQHKTKHDLPPPLLLTAGSRVVKLSLMKGRERGRITKQPWKRKHSALFRSKSRRSRSWADRQLMKSYYYYYYSYYYYCLLPLSNTAIFTAESRLILTVVDNIISNRYTIYTVKIEILKNRYVGGLWRELTFRHRLQNPFRPMFHRYYFLILNGNSVTNIMHVKTEVKVLSMFSWRIIILHLFCFYRPWILNPLQFTF